MHGVHDADQREGGTDTQGPCVQPVSVLRPAQAESLPGSMRDDCALRAHTTWNGRAPQLKCLPELQPGGCILDGITTARLSGWLLARLGQSLHRGNC